MIVNVLENKAAYYHAPKCGSRTILAWIVLLEDETLYTEHPDWFSPTPEKKIEYQQIRQRIRTYFEPAPPSEEDSGAIAVVDAEFRFCVVRDPVERFVSAFTNRILYHKNIAYKHEGISISEFIKDFDHFYKNNPNVRLHFPPQVAFYGKDPGIFSHIFGIKDMAGVKSFLESIGRKKLPDLRLQQSGKVAKPSLTPSEIDWIRKRYREDYIYEKWF